MSTSIPDRLLRVRSKIERAKHHIADLDVALRAFYDSEPYTVGVQNYPDATKLAYYVTSVKETPTSILFIAGDAIQNLRSALDHLAFQLHIVGVYCPKIAMNKVFFPIFDSAKDYKSKFHGMVKGSRKDVVDAISAVEPYKTGNGEQLWVLNKLNNIDKHRTLLTVGSAYRSVNVGDLLTGPDSLLGKSMTEMLGKDAVIPTFDIVLKPADRLCPLKAGVILLTTTNVGAKVNDKLGFHFEVALNESGIVEGQSLLETLHNTADLIGNITMRFGAFL